MNNCVCESDFKREKERKIYEDMTTIKYTIGLFFTKNSSYEEANKKERERKKNAIVTSIAPMKKMTKRRASLSSPIPSPTSDELNK